MMGNKATYIILIFVLFYACSKEQLKPSEYVKWVKNPENGLVKQKDVGGLKMELMYKPIAYIIANEEKTNEIPTARYDEREEKLSKLEQFELRLTVTERAGVDVVNWKVKNQNESQQRIEYLSFDMKHDIYMVEGKDTFPCVLYHFERSYDVAPYRKFLIGFDNKESKEDKTIILDSPVFGTGPMKINFEQKVITNIPNIKLVP